MLPRQQSESQNRPRQGAGDGDGQQRQPEKMGLPAKGDERQQQPHACLYQRFREKAPAGKEHRRGIQPAQHSAEKVAPAAQRDPRQPCRREKQQVVQQGIEQKHTVQIHHRHMVPSSHKEIISRAVPKKGRKKARRTRKPSAGQMRRFIPSAAR